MIDRDIIEAKFDIIEKNLKFLQEFKDLSVEELESNYRDLQAVKYSLLEITEACIDIANHIIAAKNLERVEEYGEMFPVLAKNRIITQKLGEKLVKMAKFRNFLIHRYGEVETKYIVEIIKFHLVDVVDFMRKIMKLLS
jgi:uncharacterized protein YutE (UPF0331/DUF86 family)